MASVNIINANPVPDALYEIKYEILYYINIFLLTFASSFWRSHSGNPCVIFRAIIEFLSLKHLSNVEWALNPITEKTTTPANIEVPQFVNETRRASL